MFTVYVLYSKSHNKIYIGFTSDIDARLLSHNQLATKGYTVKYRPWKIIHTEIFETKTDAMKREKQLKSAKGRKFIRNLIKEGSKNCFFYNLISKKSKNPLNDFQKSVLIYTILLV